MKKVHRFSSSLADTLAGPGIGGTLQLIELGMKARDATIVGDEAVQFSDFVNFGIYNNVVWPLNLFYVRPALDYLFLNSMREVASPGYLKRSAKRRKRDYDQGFWNR